MKHGYLFVENALEFINLLKVRRVLFVSKLMCSLLSVHFMKNHIHVAYFDNDGVTIIEKDKSTIATVFEDMYQIDATPLEPKACRKLRYQPSLLMNKS